MMIQKHSWFVLGTFCFIQLLLLVNGELVSVSNGIKGKLPMTNHANNSASSKLIFLEYNDDEDIFDEGSGSGMMERSGLSKHLDEWEFDRNG